jgi:MerR family mercuric resistance operon transcriptional regulator
MLVFGAMKDRLIIGELAKAAEVPASTVRYYERTGLLRRPPRSASNYRLYHEEDVYRVRFIKAAQATGFTLDDVAELLKPSSCAKVQGRIEERLEEVSARMKDLRHVRRVLKAALTTCKDHEPTGRCRVIDTLSASARSKQP